MRRNRTSHACKARDARQNGSAYSPSARPSGAESELHCLRAETKNPPQRRNYEQTARGGADSTQRRREVDAILHQRRGAVGLKMMLMPPASVGPLLLEIDEQALGLPRLNQCPPAERQRSHPQLVFDASSAGHFRRGEAGDLKAHVSRRHHAQVSRLREESE